MKLHLGCGRDIKPDWINLDSVALPGVDVVADLTQPLPYDDDSIDEFLAMHLIEHIPDPLALMAELHRIAKPGAVATFATPYGSSDDAWEDPTHVRPYFLASWGYFGQPFYWNKDYGYRGDWQLAAVELSVWDHAVTVEGKRLDGDGIMRRIQQDRNIVAEMVVQLEAIKPIREPRRELQTMPPVTLRLAQS